MTKAEAERIYLRYLDEALGAAKRGEGELAAVYSEISGRLIARFRAMGDNTNAVAIQEAIDAEFKRTLYKRVGAIRVSISAGAERGPRAARRTIRAAFGEEVTSGHVRTSRKALEEASERIAGRVTADGVSLSRRIRKWDRQLGQEMAREVQTAVRTKKGILDAAREIQKLDSGLEVKLPKYLAEVEQLARDGNVKALKKLVQSYKGRVAKLGEIQADGTRKASAYSLRGPTKRFLSDISKAGQAGVDDVVQRYVKEKAEWHAKAIARHETVEAFRNSYIEQNKSKKGVIGFRWTLSNRHRIPDECDIFATQNAHGLGPGVYPADKLPSRHPFCLCSQVSVVSREAFRGETVPVDKSSPDADAWLHQNPENAQKILGPTRWVAFKAGVPVLDGDGRPLLVRDVVKAWPQAAE